MKTLCRAIQILYAAPFIFFVLLFVYGLFAKLTGIVSFTLELFSVLVFNVTPLLAFLIVIPFLAITHEINKYKRVFFVILSFAIGFVFTIIYSPQKALTRFYFQTQAHVTLHSLEAADVAEITIEDVTFYSSEQVGPIIEALNASTWYSPNHEQRQAEASMTITLQTGQRLDFQVSRFYNEDSADVLFISSNGSGFGAYGHAYVPNLPSVLENVGYTFSNDQ